MTVSVFRPTFGRCFIAAGAAVLLFAGLAAGPAFAQDPPPPAAQAPEAPDALKFTTQDRVFVFFIVTEAGAPVFEEIMTKVKEALDKSEKPERKQQAAAFRVNKLEAVQNGQITYFALLDPVVKNVSYDPFKILAEALPPADVAALYEKLKPVLVGLSPVAYRPVTGGM
jgi:hypothetical protein